MKDISPIWRRRIFPTWWMWPERFHCKIYKGVAYGFVAQSSATILNATKSPKRLAAEQRHVASSPAAVYRLSDPATPGPNVGPHSKIDFQIRRCKR